MITISLAPSRLHEDQMIDKMLISDEGLGLKPIVTQLIS